MTKKIPVALFFLLSACMQHHKARVETMPSTLPVAISNHAVAHLIVNEEPHIYLFNGLLEGKTYQDVTQQAFVWKNGVWQALTVPEKQKPVLASVAVGLEGAVYLFGGYTVAADHSEKSIPNVWRINGKNNQWEALAPMPTPVDDAVALVYLNRYIYLVSGWHDVDNVDLVQVYDTLTDVWRQATPFPLPAVFGHAGGIVDNRMLVCDGVKVVWQGDKKDFKASPACAIGTIDPNDITRIDWREIPHHSGQAYYRMAATDDGSHKIVFAGGSDNPYNYNGVGYNGSPSSASSNVRVFDFEKNQWHLEKNKFPANMDHRGLLRVDNRFYILGGMNNDQQVVDRVIEFSLQ